MYGCTTYNVQMAQTRDNVPPWDKIKETQMATVNPMIHTYTQHTKYGTILRRWMQRNTDLYIVLYTVTYEDEQYVYTADVHTQADAQLLLYGINQWYMDTARYCRPYSIKAMQEEYRGHTA